MNISELVNTETILYGVQAESKAVLIEQMLDCYLGHTSDHLTDGHTREELLSLLYEREACESTGLGKGLAFPHARIPGYRHIGVVVAVPETPLDWHARDGLPVEIVFMVLNPVEVPHVPLKIWSSLARLLRDSNFMNDLAGVGSAEGVYDLIQENDLTVA